MRYRLLFAACLWLSAPAFAFAHTSVGGGGTDEPNADCLRWEAVPVSITDAAAGGDAGRGDGGPRDAGALVVQTKLVCVEHATMFGCACAMAAPAGNQGAAATVVMVALAIMAAASRRPR